MTKADDRAWTVASGAIVLTVRLTPRGGRDAIDGVERWQIRVVAPVWPGDQLTLHGEALEASATGDHAAVTLTAQDGRVVGKATARFKLS